MTKYTSLNASLYIGVGKTFSQESISSTRRNVPYHETKTRTKKDNNNENNLVTCNRIRAKNKLALIPKILFLDIINSFDFENIEDLSKLSLEQIKSMLSK